MPTASSSTAARAKIRARANRAGSRGSTKSITRRKDEQKENQKNVQTASANKPNYMQEEVKFASSPPLATPLKATPYHQVIREEGREMSPRTTRSAKKKKRKSDEHISGGGQEANRMLFVFSPPDHAKYEAERTKEEARLEAEHKERVEEMKKTNLMHISPPRKKQHRQKQQNASKHQKKDKMFYLEFSPGGTFLGDPNKLKLMTKAELNEALIEIQEKYGSAMEEVRDLREQLREAEETKGGIEEALNSAERHNAKLSNKVDILESQSDEAVEVCEAEASIMRNAIMERHREEVERLRSELDGALHKVKVLSSDHETILQSKETTSNKEAQLVAAEMHKATQQIVDCQQQLTLKDSTIATLEKEKMDMQYEYQEKALKTEAAAREQDISKTFMKIREQDISSLQSTFDDKVERKQEEIYKLNKKLVLAESQVDSLRSEVDELKDAIQEREGAYKSEVDSMKQELEGVKNRERDLIINNAADKAALQAKFDAMGSAEANMLKAQLHECEGKAQRAKKELSSIRKEYEKNENEREAEIDRLHCLLEQKRLEHEESIEEMRMRTEQDTSVDDLRRSFEACQKEKNTLEEENEKLASELAVLSKNMTNLMGQSSKEQAEHLQLREQLHQTKKELDAEQKHANKFRCDLTEIQSQSKQMQSNLTAAVIQRDEAVARLASVDQRESQLKHQIKVMDEVRRSLHNRVMQLSGNIRVFVRVRPALPSEEQQQQQQQIMAVATTAASSSRNASTPNKRAKVTMRRASTSSITRGKNNNLSMISSSSSSSSTDSRSNSSTASSVNCISAAASECPFRFPKTMDRRIPSSDDNASCSGGSHSSTALLSVDDLTKDVVELIEPYKDRGGLKERRKRHKFGFDGIFDQSRTQQDIWAAVEPLIQSAVDGYNVTVFAYGQTGSGKTHTMLGGQSKSADSSQGLIGRSIQKLFTAKSRIENLTQGKHVVSLSVEMIEIYNENVRDLLVAAEKNQVNNNAKRARRDSFIRMNDKEAVVGNVTVLSADSNEAVMNILATAQQRRCVRATNSNAESSRSHLLFTIHFVVRNQSGKGDVVRRSKLNICDLAGSERLNKSGATGNALRETQNINSSLSVLSTVIEKLQAKSNHVPFRDSKLTYLLQDSLGGDSKTLAIICCNPLSSHYQESLCSLRFATKVAKVDLKAKGSVEC